MTKQENSTASWTFLFSPGLPLITLSGSHFPPRAPHVEPALHSRYPRRKSPSNQSTCSNGTGSANRKKAGWEDGRELGSCFNGRRLTALLVYPHFWGSAGSGTLLVTVKLREPSWWGAGPSMARLGCILAGTLMRQLGRVLKPLGSGEPIADEAKGWRDRRRLWQEGRREYSTLALPAPGTGRLARWALPRAACGSAKRYFDNQSRATAWSPKGAKLPWLSVGFLSLAVLSVRREA